MPSFILIRKEKTHLLLREDYKDLLLHQGIDDFQAYLKRWGRPLARLRGRALHLSAPLDGDKRIVIRHYSHGGLLRFFTRNLFLSASRAFDELSLTEEIRRAGIPTVEPIGAVQESVSRFFYRAYLLTLEIPDAIDLTQFLKDSSSASPRDRLLRKQRVIRSVGKTVQQFHQAGFFHRDLQLKNILVTETQSLLIDFDRSYRKDLLSPKEKTTNLLRLNRSAEKWKRIGLPITRTDRWRFFLTYSAGDPIIRKTFVEALRKESCWSWIHRLGWTVKTKGLSAED